MGPRTHKNKFFSLKGEKQKQKASRNARLQFKQSTIHKDYLLHLYDLFKEYCGTNPKTSFISLREKKHSLPCFNPPGPWTYRWPIDHIKDPGWNFMICFISRVKNPFQLT
jgi:hypothetical protein